MALMKKSHSVMSLLHLRKDLVLCIWGLQLKLVRNLLEFLTFFLWHRISQDQQTYMHDFTGVIPTEGIPSLLRVLLPSTCTGLPVMYVKLINNTLSIWMFYGLSFTYIYIYIYCLPVHFSGTLGILS